MKKYEKRIRDDILNEMDIPNVLDKVKPYADEQASLMQENRKTIHLNFRRPARILATCLACFIGVAIVMVITISAKNGNVFSNFKSAYEAKDSAPNAAERDVFDKEDANSSLAPSENEPQYQDSSLSEEFLMYYYSNVQNDHLTNEELEKYSEEIQGYVANNKTLSEVLDMYKINESIEHEESITVIYNYYTK